jgi:hypothetical protein
MAAELTTRSLTAEQSGRSLLSVSLDLVWGSVSSPHDSYQDGLLPACLLPSWEKVAEGRMRGSPRLSDSPPTSAPAGHLLPRGEKGIREHLGAELPGFRCLVSDVFR